MNEMDLVFPTGMTKLMLTRQQPLVWVVIQDSFKILHSSLLFTNTFPDGVLTIELIKDALVCSAQNHSPGALTIYRRLLYDLEYFRKIMPLVSLMNVHDRSS